MRIVAVADTHLYTDDYEVPDGDVFVHAGDLCKRGDLDELEHAATWILGLPHAHKVIVAGNHDWAFANNPPAARALFPGVTYLQDSEATIGGLRFYGAPWQPAFHGWAFNLPRGAALAEKWARIPAGIDVLITHGPPAGFGDDIEIVGRTGCADLRARIEQVRPRLHVFGHIHMDGGLWTHEGMVIANVTSWECQRAATVIDIDADAVTPILVPPAETRR